jgi:hypothetical protein
MDASDRQPFKAGPPDARLRWQTHPIAPKKAKVGCFYIRVSVAFFLNFASVIIFYKQR